MPICVAGPPDRRQLIWRAHHTALKRGRCSESAAGKSRRKSTVMPATDPIQEHEAVNNVRVRTSDCVLLAFVGVLFLGVSYLVMHKDAYLRTPLDVAAVVACVALALALLATFRVPSPTRARIVLMVASGIAALYAMEGFFFWDPLKLRGPYPRDGFDQRGILEVVRDLRDGGTWVYPVIASAEWFESPPSVMGTPVVPLSGVPHARIVMCNEAGSYVMYTSDRFGFNGPDAIWDRPGEVALIGDSFVEGWCVRREHSLAAVIRDAYPGTLSVGLAGHGPLAELATMREYVAPLRPAHVFWFFYEVNDLTQDLAAELKSPVLRRYLEPDYTQQLRLRSAAMGNEMRRQFDARFAAWTPPEEPSSIGPIAKLRTLRALTGIVEGQEQPVVSPRPALDEFGRILAEAHRTVKGWGGVLHFVYLPDLASAMADREPPYHERVLALAADLGLPTVDLTRDFRGHPNPLSLFPYDEGRHLLTTRGLHYNADGHRLVGRRIVDALQRSQSTAGGRVRSRGSSSDVRR